MKRERKVKPFDDFTFGKYPAAISLSRIMNECQYKNGYRVAEFYEVFRSHLKKTLVSSAETADFLMLEFFVPYYKKKVNNLGLPHKIKTHLENIILASLRDWLAEQKKTT